MSAAQDVNRESSTISGFVAVTRVYEVECSECGVVGANEKRQLADAEARRHYQLRHRCSGFKIGQSYRTSTRKLVGP